MVPHVLGAVSARADDFAAIQFNFVRLWGTIQHSDRAALQNGKRRHRTTHQRCGEIQGDGTRKKRGAVTASRRPQLPRPPPLDLKTRA